MRHEAAVAATPYTQEQEVRHQQQVECLRSMANQLGSIKHTAKPDQKLLKEEGKWMDAVEVVMFVEKLIKVAMDTMALLPAGADVFLTAPPRDPALLVAARKVHDAVLASFNFGYLPPIRPSCICSIVHPSFIGTNSLQSCSAAGCKVRGCQGNHLEHLGGKDFKLVLPHHKNQSKWGNQVICFNLPMEMGELLATYCFKVWPYLRANNSVTTLFMTRKGTAMSPKQLCGYWKRMLADAGTSGHFPPRMLRHIFTTHRLEHPEVPGPSNEHAAVVMGNSVEAWVKHYHRNHQNWAAQEAVDNMAVYRAAVLRQVQRHQAAVDAVYTVPRSQEETAAMAGQFAFEEEEVEAEWESDTEPSEAVMQTIDVIEAEAAMEAMDAVSAEYAEDSEEEEEEEYSEYSEVEGSGSEISSSEPGSDFEIQLSDFDE